MALRFVMANPNVSCALSGMSSMDMIEENVQVASLPGALNDQERQIIDQMLEENKRLADLYCTGCNYCMPCPTGVNIPLNFQIMNYHRVYGLTEHAKKQYARIGIDDNMPGGKAEDCTECGTCVPLCPQGLDIIKQLRETAEALG
jgi:hypothetical protein